MGARSLTEGNSGPLKRHLILARKLHCLSVTHGYALHNTVQVAKHTHTQCTLNRTAGRQGGRQRKSEEGWRMGASGVGREQGDGVRRYDVRCGGREGGLRKGTSEEGP